MTRQPVPPIELHGSGSRLDDRRVTVSDQALTQLRAAAPTWVDERETAEASRDWWPLSLHWALAGSVGQRAAVVCRPDTVDALAAVAAVCRAHQLPLTVAGGRSGVSGASVPRFGGVLVDLCGIAGVTAVDTESGLITALAGTFGPHLERAANDHGLTVGHFPQSFEISTVGGWVACRGAGQFSTRYGKIEDIVAGLDVLLADGRTIRTGGSPAGAAGPDLTQLFTGSEGTLGIITSVTLRAHPLAPSRQATAFRVATFDDGIELCRRTLRAGATPAVLRLYDATETARSHGGDGTWCALLVLDEGDPLLVEATFGIVRRHATEVGASELGSALADAWMDHRNDTSALQALVRKGFVVDTMEVAAPWAALPGLFNAVTSALRAVAHCRVASCHLSHSYVDGACLYFTFAATPPSDQVDATYMALWDAAQFAALGAGSNLSHHHGIGINRGRFMAAALGEAFDVLQQIKDALDPQGILNPGKLGLSSDFGQASWL